MNHAATRQCDGVICGHIHTPTLKKSDSVLYCNTGDWVENCTGLVEHLDGTLQLVCRYGKGQTLELAQRHAESADSPDWNTESDQETRPPRELAGAVA